MPAPSTAIDEALVTTLQQDAELTALMRKLRPVLKAHESRMIARVGAEGRDRLVALLHEIARGANGTRRVRGAKASRSPRAGSAAT